MKHLLNTLYITTQDSYLSKDGECVAIHHKDSLKGKIPIHNLDSIVLFGQVTCSPYLLNHCAEHGVSISWLTQYGKFLATMHGPVSGNVLLRKAQYKKSDDAIASASIALSIVIGKISNCRTILLRASRNKESEILKGAIKRLEDCLHRLKDNLSSAAVRVDTVRGIEGEAAQIYFGVFGQLIQEQTGFSFSCRNRRPPKDPVNCLLSFLYTLLTHDVRSALESCGLDPAVGFLHRDRPGRPSLALDLMEELRPYLVDRLVCTLINRGQIKTSDFTIKETGGVYMDDDTRRVILTSWQERKQEIVEHPFLKEKVAVGVICHCQARLLARYIRGDLASYPPFVIR